TLTLTYIKDISEAYESIYHIYRSYKTEVLSLDLHIFLNEIKMINISISEIEKINQIYFGYVAESEGSLVIQLYSRILHKIILDNTGLEKGKEVIKYVSTSIEKLKTQILETPEIKNVSDQNKMNNTVQNLIQMHNLVPTSMSMPLSDLISKLGIDSSFKNNLEKYLENISKILLSKDKKIGFIVLTKIINRPLEYNFWTLFDKEYLENKNLIQSTDVGLNQKVLERYQTIVPAKQTQEIKDSVVIIPASAEVKEYYIIETIDGINYRFLTPFSGLATIPASWFENILNKEYSPSRRLELYNINLDQEILNHLSKPLISMDILTREEVQKEENYWRSLRNKIKIQIINHFTDLFVHKFISNSLEKNKSENKDEKNADEKEIGENKKKNKKNKKDKSEKHNRDRKKEKKISSVTALTLTKITNLILDDELVQSAL